MVKLSEKEMRAVAGGKSYRCSRCGTVKHTWVTYLFHDIRCFNRTNGF